MGVEISQRVVEDLLTSFMSAALGLDMHERMEQLDALPMWYRQRLEPLLKENGTWIAWTTGLGVVTATGRYDPQRSRQTNKHVLLIEWWISPDTHHLSWWRADPDRPHEWTEVSGWAPSARRFSRPSWRYLRRHSLLPVGAISRYRPRPSNSL